MAIKSPHPRSHGLLRDGWIGVPDLLPELWPPLLQDDPAGPQFGSHKGCRQGKEGDQEELHRAWVRLASLSTNSPQKSEGQREFLNFNLIFFLIFA